MAAHFRRSVDTSYFMWQSMLEGALKMHVPRMCKVQSANSNANGVASLMNSFLPSLEIGDLKIYPPIIQGGMGVRVSGPRLASAVSNTGALGVIASVGVGETGKYDGMNFTDRSACGLRDMIREARSMTKMPVAVNIMCALTNYESLVRVAVEEKIDAIISGAGLPLALPGLVKTLSVKLMPIVSSGRAARIICKSWLAKHGRLPDAFIVEGPMAGGHIGFTMDDALAGDRETSGLSRVLPEVLEVAAKFTLPSGKPIPVVAAGGIFDGSDIVNCLKQGASGVQMGTRFVCTEECDASRAFKDQYINAKKEDIIVLKSPVGMPLRVIRNAFVDRILRGERTNFECKYHCLSTCQPGTTPYCIAKALVNAQLGELDSGFAPCGSNAYRIHSLVSVKELVAELVAQAKAILSPLPSAGS